MSKENYTWHLRSLSLLFILATTTIAAQDNIDISGNNTSDSYVSYDKYISLPAGKTLDVWMARYCYFSSTIVGNGTLNLHAGGERCYLGTAKGASWPNWSNYTGNIHVFPYPENSSSAGFYGVVLAHGGKSFSPENIDDAIRSGKINNSMENNHVTLHQGATICCEANTNGAGFRIGELQTEEGSTLLGYMKKQRAAYYILGALNTDFTLAGKIAPTDYRDDTLLGIIKEGTGTLSINGNDNYLSGSLRIINGRVLIVNNRTEAETKKLRGALGAKASSTDAIAYVFEQGVLGGTGNIAGTVDNYGTIEPGTDQTGTLVLANYKTSGATTNLIVRPASKLSIKIASSNDYDQLTVNGAVEYNNIAQDFTPSDKMPLIQVNLQENADVNLGDEFCILTAKTKKVQNNEWHFQLQKPEHYTWEIEEKEDNDSFSVILRLVSFNNQDPDNPDNPDNPDQPGMGAFYNDGIDDATDTTPLKDYAAKNNKRIGTAISTWKTNISNENLAETKEAGRQFSLLVAENEMKFDALQPNQGQFSYGAADNLVSFAKRHQMTVRGHCLVWHQQQPQWVSSDGTKNDKNWSREEALKILKDHITNVMGHFKGNVVEWDVVNECLDDDQTIVRTNPDAYTLRATVWQRAIGDDYIDSAFVYAHRADPTALLYLNDYDVELQGKAKAAAFYNLAMHLKNRNIPIDGVGLQCHFSVGDVDSVKLANTFQRFADAGLQCIITELDMGIPSTSAQNLEEQARNYRVITDIMLNNDNCPHMVIWGLKDNDSWRNQSNPLLYTSGLEKKPAFFAVRSALRHRVIVNEQNSIENPITSFSAGEEVIYDLQGRKIANGLSGNHQLQKGLYIIHGKKILIK